MQIPFHPQIATAALKAYVAKPRLVLYATTRMNANKNKLIKGLQTGAFSFKY
jgi:hypothetical protein